MFIVWLQVQKQACDKFDPSFHPRFKKWCDDYFYIKHRNERRGLGGIFFDDLNDYDQEMLLNFATECADSVLPAYIPIIERRKDTPFTEEHKAWQQLRRGRYVEFNLVSGFRWIQPVSFVDGCLLALISSSFEGLWSWYNIWPKDWWKDWEHTRVSSTHSTMAVWSCKLKCRFALPSNNHRRVFGLPPENA
jgi:hypothetical protein